MTNKFRLKQHLQIVLCIRWLSLTRDVSVTVRGAVLTPSGRHGALPGGENAHTAHQKVVLGYF